MINTSQPLTDSLKLGCISPSENFETVTSPKSFPYDSATLFASATEPVPENNLTGLIIDVNSILLSVYPYIIFKVARAGFEPTLTEPKSVVLPLDDRAKLGLQK